MTPDNVMSLTIVYEPLMDNDAGFNEFNGSLKVLWGPGSET